MSRLSGLTCLAMMLVTAASAALAEVRVERLPAGGIQPQAEVADDGTAHMIYFRGEAGAGDIFYVRRAPGDAAYSEPVRVNSQAGSAIAAGTVRGPRMALGRDGRVHVAWMGSSTAEPKAPGDATPMLYSRLNDEGTAFEPQRNVIQQAVGVDGGGTVAADGQGHVYVVWHGQGEQPGEAHRRVYVAVSEDDGQSFAHEVPASSADLGACACCGIEARVDARENLHILYRSATDSTERGAWLLSSRDGGSSFTADELEPWQINACPMSTGALAGTADRLSVAWETKQRISFATMPQGQSQPEGPHRATGRQANQKHPALAVNAAGQTLLVWAEGTAWARGGSVAWQVYDADGRAVGARGRADGLPAWGRPAAWAEPDGSFVICY